MKEKGVATYLIICDDEANKMLQVLLYNKECACSSYTAVSFGEALLIYANAQVPNFGIAQYWKWGPDCGVKQEEKKRRPNRVAGTTNLCK